MSSTASRYHPVKRFSDAVKADGFRAQILKGGIGSVAVKVASTGLAFCVVTVLARVLGPEDYGIYTYVVALVSLLTIPVEFGLPNLVVRETAKAHANQAWAVIRGLWRWATLVAVAFALLLAAVSLVAAHLLSNRFETESLQAFLYGLTLVLLVPLGKLRGAALRGLRRIVAGQLPEDVIRPVLLVAMVAVAFRVAPNGSLTATQAMACHVLAALSAFLIGAVLLIKARPAGLRTVTTTVYYPREWVRAAIPLGVIGGLQLTNAHCDLIMLGMFLSAEEVGLYRVAAQVSALITVPITAVNMMIAPHVSRLYTLGETHRLRSLVRACSLASFVSGAAIAAVFLLLGKQILAVTFGEAFVDSFAPMVVLSIAQLMIAALGSLITLASMTGHEKPAAVIIGCGTILNILLNLILIPQFGMMGAAIATVVSLSMWRAWLTRWLKRHVGVNASIFSFAALVRTPNGPPDAL